MGFDWGRAYERLERAVAALASGATRSREDEARILEARARAIARRPEEASAGEERELVVFGLGGETYAVDAAQVLEAVPVRGLVPVPGTPDVLAGVVHHRGRLLPLLDLRVLLGLAAGAVLETSRAVAVEAGGMTFGLLADGVSGVARVREREIAPPPAQRDEVRRRLVQGIVGGAALLDLEALAADPRIRVEEAGP